MKNVSSILLGATLLSVVACGNNTKSNSGPSSESMLLTQDGHYQATLSPINTHLAGDITGTAQIKVKRGFLTVEVKVNGSPSQIVHTQNIHIADACPTLASDVNKDGVIDSKEGQKSYGPAIIPLDSDLKTQVGQNAKFPISDFSGNYFYHQDVSITQMMKDLTNKDNDMSDNVVKIRSNLGFAGRQIVIYGVPANADLPETVSTIKGKSKQSSLPIACGSLIKVADEIEGTSNGGKDE